MESPRYSASRGGCPLNAYQWPDLVAYDTSDQPLNPSPGASAWTSLVASCRDCRGVHTSMESSCQKVACFISHQACCKKRHEVHIFLRCKNHKNRNRELLQKTLKKMKSISNDDEMVLMFLNKIIQSSGEDIRRENFLVWSRSLSFHTYFRMSGWALVGRIRTTSKEAEESFQRAHWPGVASSCVSEVKHYYFIISIWLYIQYALSYSALVATCSGLIGQICLFAFETSEKPSLVQKTKCHKII